MKRYVKPSVWESSWKIFEDKHTKICKDISEMRGKKIVIPKTRLFDFLIKKSVYVDNSELIDISKRRRRRR